MFRGRRLEPLEPTSRFSTGRDADLLEFGSVRSDPDGATGQVNRVARSHIRSLFVGAAQHAAVGLQGHPRITYVGDRPVATQPNIPTNRTVPPDQTTLIGMRPLESYD